MYQSNYEGLIIYEEKFLENNKKTAAAGIIKILAAAVLLYEPVNYQIWCCMSEDFVTSQKSHHFPNLRHWKQ